MDSQAYKLADFVSDWWPYIAALFATALCAAKLWWIDRSLVLQRLNQIERLLEHVATKDDIIVIRQESHGETLETLAVVSNMIVGKEKGQ